MKQEDATCTSDERPRNSAGLKIATPSSASLVGASARDDAMKTLAGILKNEMLKISGVSKTKSK